jgi:hypothetical protein
MAVSPPSPPPGGYLKWSEIPITFDRSDQQGFIPKLGWYPLIVCPIVNDVQLSRVLVNGGSSLHILFLKTFYQMRLSRCALCPNQDLFHSIIPGAATPPVDQITLLVIFGTHENFHTEHL